MELKRCSECDYQYTAKEKAPPAEYFHEIKYLDNLVLVVFYKAAGGGKEEIARAHGHIIHPGVEGIAQATSYAMRGIWEQIRKQ
jgi:hypothetical protein